jgi:hypothetical protein
VIRVCAAPLHWLAAIAAVFALLATSNAVEPYRLPSGKLKNERVPLDRSLKLQKLAPYRAAHVSPFTPRKGDLPARYTRKHEGTQRVSR